MNSEYVKQIIKDRAAQIRAGVQGGMLYGEPIDMDNPDAVLVAAICKADTEAGYHASKMLDAIIPKRVIS